MTTGQKIKMRRKELGMSAETLAAKLGCSPATIYRYESGFIEKVNADKLMPIAEILKTTPADLMGWGGEKVESNDEKIIRQIQTIAETLPPEKLELARSLLLTLADSSGSK